jgi:hypothetical protein
MTDIQILILIAAIPTVIVATFFTRFRNEFIVTEGFAGLLYHDGKLVETLTAGRHTRWGRNFRIAHLDTRKTLLQVAGQEVLSADNVGVSLASSSPPRSPMLRRACRPRTTTRRTSTARRRRLFAPSLPA